MHCHVSLRNESPFNQSTNQSTSQLILHKEDFPRKNQDRIIRVMLFCIYNNTNIFRVAQPAIAPSYLRRSC